MITFLANHVANFCKNRIDFLIQIVVFDWIIFRKLALFLYLTYKFQKNY
jgi:hypothetical protein